MAGSILFRLAIGVSTGLVVSPAMAQVVLHQISGMAWRDRVADGVRASHEAGLGIPDHTVELRDGVTNAVLRTTTTDVNGRYQFSYGSTQASRSYRISTTAPSTRYLGFSPRRVGSDRSVDSDIHSSGPNEGQSDTFVVTLNAPATHMDIGLVMRSVSIGDLAWFDRVENGVQHEFEPGLQGLLVEAWNAERTIRFDQTVTDVMGKYRVQLPGWGPYRLKFETLPGTSFTERLAGDDPVIDNDVYPGGAYAGWTGVVQIGSSTISIQMIDAGYVIPDDGVDAALDYAEPISVVFPGFGASWSLRVREGLGREITSVRIRAPIPAGIQGMSWTCTLSLGASCPSGGTDALDFTTELSNNSELEFDFVGMVTPGAGSLITANAEVTVGAPQWDAIPQNSIAQVQLRNDRMFGNGFQ